MTHSRSNGTANTNRGGHRHDRGGEASRSRRGRREGCQSGATYAKCSTQSARGKRRVTASVGLHMPDFFGQQSQHAAVLVSEGQSIKSNVQQQAAVHRCRAFHRYASIHQAQT